MRPPGTIWTPAMHDRLRELYRDEAKLSFDGIAAKMNVDFGTSLTRNACIGKAHRLMLPLRGANSTKKVRKPREPTMQKQKPDGVPLPADPEPFTTTIYQLTPYTCRWPGGDMTARPPFMYCGEEANDFNPYCDHHMLVAHPRQRL